jgi:pimeloyl-ACP methyl ester carboxylesterase
MVDPNRRWESLDQMVLIGHSMGGLVSRMQTLESGDDFWRILTDRSFEELNADAETRERLASTVFFEPNPSIRRVITIGTPHRGSYFANDYTRWAGRKLITLPTALVQVKTRVIRDNPGFFDNTELLTVTTSIDSLAPDSPVLPVMLSSQRSPAVTYHNIVGVISKKNILARVSEKGDGVVPYSSAHLDDVASEIVVDADHVTVHQHPRSILEVRRILLEHSTEMYAETSRRMAVPAAYNPLPLPPVVPAEGW